jgi:hypothetical protein
MSNGEFLTFDVLIKNRFSLIIPSVPDVTFFIQNFEFPTVTVNEVNITSRIVDYNGIGEKLNYEPVNLTFLVDKYSRNWASVFNWMKKMTVDGSSVDFEDNIVLMIDGKEFLRFNGAWPTALTGYSLDSTIEDVQYVKATVTFNYDYFDYLGQFTTVDSVYK